MKALWWFGLCALTAAAPIAAAKGKAAERSADRLRVQFENTPLVDIVKWYSTQTGRNFIVSDGERERFTIVSGQTVPVEQAWEALRQALADRRLELVESGAFTRIVRARPPRDGERTGLQAGARIVPAVRDGQPYGLKVFAIEPGSALDRLGLQNGDVVVRVNGRPVTSPEEVHELYRQNPAAERIELVLQRRGEELTHTFPPRSGAPAGRAGE